MCQGGILNDKTIAELRCKGIAGLENNQLERANLGRKLLDLNIAYVPDFVVNAGGMMGASMPIFSVPNKEKSLKRIKGIFDTATDILERSKSEDVSTEAIAEQIAMERIDGLPKND